MQFGDSACPAHLSLRCPLTESMDKVVYVDDRADLDLLCLHMK